MTPCSFAVHADFHRTRCYSAYSSQAGRDAKSQRLGEAALSRTEVGAGVLLHLPRTLQERRVLKLAPHARRVVSIISELLRRNGNPADGDGRQILSASGKLSAVIIPVPNRY